MSWSSAAAASQECMSQGCHVIVGPSDIPAWLFHFFSAELPVISHEVMEDLPLGFKDQLPLFVELPFHPSLFAKAAAGFFAKAGVRQVVLLHGETRAAVKQFAEVLQANGASQDLSVLPIPVADLSKDTLRAALSIASSLPTRVLMVSGIEAAGAGMDLKEYVIILCNPSSSQAATTLDVEVLGAAGVGKAGAVLTIQMSENTSVAGTGSVGLPYLYDAFWSVGIAAAGVTGNGSSSALQWEEEEGLLGWQIQQRLVSGTVDFEGASGRLRWDADGNRASLPASVEVLVVTLQGEELLLSPVASVDPSRQPPTVTVLDTKVVNGVKGHDAKAQVSPDWSEWVVMLVGILIGVTAALGALACGVLLYKRISEMQAVPRIVPMPSPPTSPRPILSPKSPKSIGKGKRRVTIHSSVSRHLPGSERTLDLESPYAKMVDFLRRYEEGGWQARRPNKAEAVALREVIESAENLMAPNLQAQLSLAAPYSERVTDFLVHTTSVAAPSSRLNPRYSMGRPAIETSEASTTFASFWDESESRRASRQELISMSYGEVPADPNAHMYKVKSGRQFAVPLGIMKDLTLNFKVDFISEDSPMFLCAEPLPVVLKQALKTTGTGFVLKDPDNALLLLAFARRMEAGYLEGGYHCKRHAADVTHRMACILNNSEIAGASAKSTTQSTLVLATLVAACLHDFEHPQVTNNYLVSNEDPKAVAFNYQAVAENHSLRTSLALMLQEQYDFSSCFGKERVQEFRQHIIQIVLATDMSRHFELLVQFKTKVLHNEELEDKVGGEAWEAMDHQKRLLVLQMAMKVADLGHCMLPIEQHVQWVGELQEEMFVQGDHEREQGIPISPMMDRNSKGVLCPASQVGFFEVIVIPLVEMWVQMFPGCLPLIEQAEDNLQHWREQQQLQEAVEGKPDHPQGISKSARSFGRPMIKGGQLSMRRFSILNELSSEPPRSSVGGISATPSGNKRVWKPSSMWQAARPGSTHASLEQPDIKPSKPNRHRHTW
eukprot:CAMPEP_0117695216 /NCGR_PEP_ID=MMETSP0804-20121206/28015_1 /TAXON_ID=1074897 /ORGANISM="Tetraselmis astigmatica, Strain CCMP880" /LENGTH=1002 /DNA_ID=CAMNT_0005509261 /DNA_START=216 /DNA_END=3225 /DNA_ORIENTATION=-